MDGMDFWEQVPLYGALGGLPWIFVTIGRALLWSAHKFMARAGRAETDLSTRGYNVASGSEPDILIGPHGYRVYGFGAIFARIGLILAIGGIVIPITI